jgi:hypothetical protein
VCSTYHPYSSALLPPSQAPAYLAPKPLVDEGATGMPLVNEGMPLVNKGMPLVNEGTTRVEVEVEVEAVVGI